MSRASASQLRVSCARSHRHAHAHVLPRASPWPRRTASSRGCNSERPRTPPPPRESGRAAVPYDAPSTALTGFSGIHLSVICRTRRPPRASPRGRRPRGRWRRRRRRLPRSFRRVLRDANARAHGASPRDVRCERRRGAERRARSDRPARHRRRREAPADRRWRALARPAASADAPTSRRGRRVALSRVARDDARDDARVDASAEDASRARRRETARSLDGSIPRAPCRWAASSSSLATACFSATPRGNQSERREARRQAARASHTTRGGGGDDGMRSKSAKTTRPRINARGEGPTRALEASRAMNEGVSYDATYDRGREQRGGDATRDTREGRGQGATAGARARIGARSKRRAHFRVAFEGGRRTHVARARLRNDPPRRSDCRRG